jgi:hypothetical protein
MIAAMLDPFVLNENHLTLGVSIGIAAHKDGEMDPEELLQQADQAMYRAKLAGGTRTGNSESSAIRLVARQDTKNDHGAFGIEMKADAQISRTKPEFVSERTTEPFDLAFCCFNETKDYARDSLLICFIEAPKIFFGELGPPQRQSHSAIPSRRSSSSCEMVSPERASVNPPSKSSSSGSSSRGAPSSASCNASDAVSNAIKMRAAVVSSVSGSLSTISCSISRVVMMPPSRLLQSS